MALNSYLRLKGQKQGDIKGSVIQKTREDTIMVIAVSHSIISPRDAASGLPTGKRMHKPLVITKELDKSSPLLYNVLCNNENITKWKLEFFQPQQDQRTGLGSEINHFVIELENASIASISFRSPNNKHPDLMKFAEYEEVAFVYEKITWTWVKGGVMASDAWLSPITG